jgi:hypothetical protein
MAGHGLLLDGPAPRKWKSAIGETADIDDVGALLGRLASKIGRGCAEIQNRLRPASMPRRRAGRTSRCAAAVRAPKPNCGHEEFVSATVPTRG